MAAAARAFGLDAGSLRSLGGASGSAWRAGDQVLRIGGRAVIDAELAASAAAAPVVPVPRILGRIEVGRCSVVRLESLPGQTAAKLAARRPEVAPAAGRACGRLHARLAAIPGPPGLRLPPGPPAGPVRGLLHLDLHPLNVLVGEDGAVTGVLDWANAATGDPVLDQARTWSILELDPQARARRADPGFAALASGWLESGGLAEVRPAARAWACRFMLADLAGRYQAGQLRHVAEALAAAEAATRPG